MEEVVAAIKKYKMALVGTTAEFKYGSTDIGFPKLPTEIRLQIWEDTLTLEGSRVVEVKIQRGFKYDTQRAFPRYSTTHATPLLYVCRESREVALKNYQLYFGAVPFNPIIDTLYLSKDVWNPHVDGSLSLLRMENRIDGLRSLAADFHPWITNFHPMMADIRHFTNLQEIIFVVLDDSNMFVNPWMHFRSFVTLLRSVKAQQAQQAQRERNPLRHGKDTREPADQNFPVACYLARKTDRGLRFYEGHEWSYGFLGERCIETT
jgi:hypothetical protein